MISASPEPEDGDATAFKDPLPYLHHFNEELAEEGHDPLFSEEPGVRSQGYDLTRSFDFRSWPEVEGMSAREFPPFVDVPDSRIRVIGEHDGKLLHACYERIEDTTPSASYEDALRGFGRYKWRVTYRIHAWEHCTCSNAKLEFIGRPGAGDLYHSECGRWRKSKVDGPFGSHVASLNLGMPDENYNGYYPTIPGDDVAHLNPHATGMDAHRGGKVIYGSHGLDNNNRIVEDRQEIRGGTEIRGGRAEHRKKTKDLILWDKGTQKDIDRIKKEKADKIKEQSRKRIEERFKQMPPSWTDL